MEPEPAPWSSVDHLLVRPYAVAGGRTSSPHAQTLQLDAQLEPGVGRLPEHLVVPEAQQILSLCGSRRRTVAELSGTVGQPVPVVRVLVGDLLAAHALELAATTFTNSNDVIKDVLKGLRRMRASGT